jgi:FkbM family methyltransferase
MRSFGFCPLQVLDVGAFHGHWARACLEMFPQSHITCIEPQDQAQKHLRKLSHEYKNVQVIQTLLGGRPTSCVPFREQGSGSSVLLSTSGVSTTKPMTTIDELIHEGRCAPPDFIKLDVQGYEIEVLKGWTQGFEKCQVIQCEMSLLPFVAHAPLLHELVVYLYKRNFLMSDITEVIRAPSDGATWQIDALFCPKDSPLRTERVWRKKG